MVELHDDFPGFSDLVRICRAQDDDSWNGPQRCKVLDRLVGWSVFSDTNGVVGEDVDHGNFHQRTQPEGRPYVVAEDEKSRAVGSDFDQAETVQDRPHRMFAYAEVQVSAGIVRGLEIAASVEGESGLGGGSQVGGATDQPGHVLPDGIQHLAGRFSGGKALGIGREAGKILVPALR